MNPVIVEVGPFALHWYGVFIVGGAIIATWLAARKAQQAGENPDHLWNLLVWSLIVGIIGARLYHVFSSPADGGGWAYYQKHPVDIINFWHGGFRGLGIYGGLVGGVLAVAFYCWRHHLNPIQYLDFIAPNVLLAQAIGRLGNFANQELYGQATAVPWAFHINPHYPCALPPAVPAAIQSCGAPNLTAQSMAWYATHGFHPTFFYEIGWNLLMFALLTWLIARFGRFLRQGDAILLYLIAYPLGRFWVEMFRPDAWTLGQLATAQWIAIGCVAIGCLGLLVRHIGWRPKQAPQESLI